MHAAEKRCQIRAHRCSVTLRVNRKMSTLLLNVEKNKGFYPPPKRVCVRGKLRTGVSLNDYLIRQEMSGKKKTLMKNTSLSSNVIFFYPGYLFFIFPDRRLIYCHLLATYTTNKLPKHFNVSFEITKTLLIHFDG